MNVRRSILLLAPLSMLLFTQIPDARSDERQALESRVEFVRKLIEESSAAQEIEHSDNKAALAMREKARELYGNAVRAMSDNELDVAEQALSDAIKTMFDAVESAKPEHGDADRSEQEYERRRETIDALLVAHKRIAEEKHDAGLHAALQHDIASELAEAEAAHDSGDLVFARRNLESVYEQIKVALEKLRGGDTLIRELKFETEEDEYRYELDRNDTHRMLVTVLLTEKMQDDSIRQRTSHFVEIAEGLRNEAEQQAATGAYRLAIGTMERSTSELVKAIRSAGVYIPG